LVTLAVAIISSQVFLMMAWAANTHFYSLMLPIESLTYSMDKATRPHSIWFRDGMLPSPPLNCICQVLPNKLY